MDSRAGVASKSRSLLGLGRSWQNSLRRSSLRSPQKKKFGMRGFRWNRGDINQIIKNNSKYEIDPKWIVKKVGNKIYRLNMNTFHWGKTTKPFNKQDAQSINTIYERISTKLKKFEIPKSSEKRKRHPNSYLITRDLR